MWVVGCDECVLMWDFAVWTVWEQEAEKKRRQGITAELERRREAQLEAELRRQEMKESLK